ncbi:hypothetical protein V496_06297 [Pseudogymnoascus sp. VKM F-4515 (FW-2607)]|nr:hypothetical protein V496_06297 [Pseudogymnoascus sp. VKM F-4515 (FW-2607)]
MWFQIITVLQHLPTAPFTNSFRVEMDLQFQHTTRDFPYIHRETEAPQGILATHVGTAAAITRLQHDDNFWPSTQVQLGTWHRWDCNK